MIDPSRRRLGELVGGLDAGRRIEARLLQIGREEIDALHAKKRPVEPVEIQGEKAGAIISRDRLRVAQDVVEAFRRIFDAGRLEHRLVVEQQALGDIEGDEVILAFEHPIREIFGVEARAHLRLLLEERSEIHERALARPFEPEPALDVDDVGRRASGELCLVESGKLGPLLVEPFDLDAGVLRLEGREPLFEQRLHVDDVPRQNGELLRSGLGVDPLRQEACRGRPGRHLEDISAFVHGRLPYFPLLPPPRTSFRFSLGRFSLG